MKRDETSPEISFRVQFLVDQFVETIKDARDAELRMVKWALDTVCGGDIGEFDRAVEQYRRRTGYESEISHR